MLQDSCPICGTPLMRHPTNRSERFCATCNATVVDQTQDQDQPQPQQQPKPVASAVPSIVPNTSVAPVAASSGFSSLRDTLAIKLSLLHDAMREVDPVRDVARFNELCVSIQRCGNAMNAINGL
jgi:uncharacterized Zn finger protein (UPF0148 family)